MKNSLYLTEHFKSVTALIPVVNETDIFEQVVERILSDCKEDITEVIFLVCSRTTLESMKICEKFQERQPGRFKIHHQKLPGMGGALREGFDLAFGSHVLVIFSDGEADPCDVKKMIIQAKQKPNAIISPSRWLAESRFEGYGSFKLICNFLAQKLFQFLYTSKVTDYTFGYRIFPKELLKSIHWEEVLHPIVVETTFKPLKFGIEIVEIPTIWRARHQGASNQILSSYYRYFWLAVKYKFYSKSKTLVSQSPYQAESSLVLDQVKNS